ncbi:LCP family protein [Aestuariimicrobium ganziense]|uniref:LCP family protein n=1 Tax=Aestuariimicrobium ganziense TaxID=2773677 RepID=UPI00194318EF|nr:LCP family protein [Aestuariimicrobium ganziense]
MNATPDPRRRPDGAREDDLDWLYSDQRRAVPGEQADPPTRVDQPPLDRTRVDQAGVEQGRVAGPPPASRRPAAQQGRRSQPSSRDRRRDQGAPPPPAGTEQEPRPTQRRRRRRGGVGRFIALLLVLVVLWLVGVPLFHLARAGSVDASPGGSRPADQPGTAILLTGTDDRPGAEGARTDTMMILFIPDEGKPALISLPRDSYVQIPGKGSNKLNAAYAFGGPKLLVQTVEANTGLRIDGYLQIGMAAFPRMVDAVGGIEVCLDKPMKDRDSKADFPAGCQQMDGKDALAYTRMRKADPKGDLGRIERQREVIGKVVDKAVSPATLLPNRYWALNSAGADLVTKSSDTSTGELARAALAFRTISSGGGISMTVPIANADAHTSAGSSVLWDEALAKRMFADLARGDTSKLTSYQR